MCTSPLKKGLGRLVVRSLQAPCRPVVVCNPRKNALLKHGNKNDCIGARKLADLLRLDDLEPVYHGQTGVRTLRELARCGKGRLLYASSSGVVLARQCTNRAAL